MEFLECGLGWRGDDVAMTWRWHGDGVAMSSEWRWDAPVSLKNSPFVTSRQANPPLQGRGPEIHPRNLA